MTTPLVLHNFWVSSASHRVRIALHHKGLPFEYVSVPILQQDTDRFAGYRAMNPQALVPTLIHGEVQLTQSLAILEYLEEIAPSPSLLPADPGGRARARSLAQYIVSEIQPLQNLRVFRYLKSEYGKTEEEGMAWRRHWVALGLDALEKELASPATGTFCHGDAPTIADACLVPQVHAARRWGLEVERWPILTRIARHADTLEAFRKAAPESQPDAPRK
jgi:maleylacetoacetate isomerase